MLNYAVLAPSSHNTQPWLFRVQDDSIEVWADRRRALAVVDPGDRELVMSCGTALYHLRVALRHFGCASSISLRPDSGDPDLMARLTVGESIAPSYNDERLFMAIKRRRTNRMPFEDWPVPDPELRHLRQAAADEGAMLHVFQTDEEKTALADLIAMGNREQAEDPRFRRELAAWVHPNRSTSRDGIPGAALGYSDLASYAVPFVIRTFDWGDGRAARDHELAAGSPVLLVVSTREDDTRAWLQAGQALDRVLLQAQAFDLQASYLNQPLEVSSLRSDVQALLSTPAHPQLILRMGYPEETVPPTPRRAPRDMLLEGETVSAGSPEEVPEK